MRRRTGSGERRLDFVDRGRSRMFQQLGGLDHHAVLAEAAQWRLLLDPGLLNGVKRLLRVRPGQALLLCPSSGQTFQSYNRLAGGGRKRRYARADLLAIEQDRTGPALRQSAAELRAGQLEVVSQDIKKRRGGRRLDVTLDSVDDDRDHENSFRERCRPGHNGIKNSSSARAI